MRCPHGTLTGEYAGGRRVARDTITCAHCNTVVFVKPGTAATVYEIYDPLLQATREEPGAFCRVCMAAICVACHVAGRCTPFERRLEAAEARDRLYRTTLASSG